MGSGLWLSVFTFIISYSSLSNCCFIIMIRCTGGSVPERCICLAMGLPACSGKNSNPFLAKLLKRTLVSSNSYRTSFLCSWSKMFSFMAGMIRMQNLLYYIFAHKCSAGSEIHGEEKVLLNTCFDEMSGILFCYWIFLISSERGQRSLG